MRKFKGIDFLMSTFLLTSLAIILITIDVEKDEPRIKIDILFICFFLGVWQIISMMIHFFKWDKVTYKITRVVYASFSFIVLMYSFLTRIEDWPHTYLLPFMGLFYTCLCGYEVLTANKPPSPINQTKTLVIKITAIIISIGITVFTLSQYTKLIQHLINIKYNWVFELCMVVGMIIFQYVFIYENKLSVKFEYYFNMLLISLFGSVMLWPLLLLNHFYKMGDVFTIIYFLAVVLTLFFIHKRKVAQLNLPVHLSYTWVLYRLLILIFIL